jgi:hypothetical protein
MKLTGKIVGGHIDFRTNKPTVSIEINELNDFKVMMDELNDKTLSIEVKPYRPKRSLDSNAYCWVLLDKLSEKLKIPKIEIYQKLIRDVGGVSETICVKNEAVERLCEGWGRNGIGWVTDTFPSKIEGCTNVILYYGSSTYDKAQMQRLTELIVNECEAQGIETRTPDELANLLSLWEGK